MADFIIVMRSTAGMIQGEFQAPVSLSTWHTTYGEPGPGTDSDMSLWNTLYWDQTALTTLSEFSGMNGIRFDNTDLYSYFANTDANNQKKLCEFKVENSTLAPTGGYAAIAIMGYLYGDVFNFRAYRRVYGGQSQLISSTELATLRSLNISDNYIHVFKLVAGLFARDNYELYGFGLVGLGYDDHETIGEIYCASVENFESIFGGVPSGQPESPTYGPAAEPGGYSGYTPVDSDPFTPTPLKPGVMEVGLFHMYKCDVGSLALLGDTLFPTIQLPPAPSGTGITDIVEYSKQVAQWVYGVVDTIGSSIWYKDLSKYIITCHIVPVDVAAGALTDIKIGPKTITGILARPIDNEIVEFDCESITIPETFHSFVDYMAQCRLYLPFYGFVTLKPEFWLGADLHVKYIFNVIDGSFIAQVFSTITAHQGACETLVGQYSGCAVVHIPLSGADYASMFGGMISNAGGAAISMASGNIVGAATGVANAVVSAAGNGSVQMSNPYNASSSFYSHSRPYIIIERPVSHFSEMYPNEKGLPLLVSGKIGAHHGFVRADNPILDGIPCTEAEKERIRALLKAGIIIK